jgi:hypothetical protein
VFTFKAEVSHGSIDDFNRDRAKPQEKLDKERSRLQGKVVAISRAKKIRILSVQWTSKEYYETYRTESGKKRSDKSKGVATLIAWATKYPDNDALYDPSGNSVVNTSDEQVDGYDPELITDEMLCRPPSEDEDDADHVLPGRRIRAKAASSLKPSVLYKLPVLDDEYEQLSSLSDDAEFVLATLRNPSVTPLMLHGCLDNYHLCIVNDVMVRTFGLWEAPGATHKNVMYALIVELFQ